MFIKNLLIKFRNIKVKYRINLREVKTDTREAVFENLESPTRETTTVKVGVVNYGSVLFPSFMPKKCSYQ
jgi:hypothetical protein